MNHQMNPVNQLRPGFYFTNTGEIAFFKVNASVFSLPAEKLDDDSAM